MCTENPEMDKNSSHNLYLNNFVQQCRFYVRREVGMAMEVKATEHKSAALSAASYSRPFDRRRCRRRRRQERRKEGCDEFRCERRREPPTRACRGRERGGRPFKVHEASLPSQNLAEFGAVYPLFCLVTAGVGITSIS